MKVCIINGNAAYESMFIKRGHTVVVTVEEADLVQFTGGADVSPSLYGQELHPSSFCSKPRDDWESHVFDECLDLEKPMAGICRGGQFLNVLSGGAMYQHVDNHAIGGTHEALDLLTGRWIPVSSTHHQMMRPSKRAIVVATAAETSYLQDMDGPEVRVSDPYIDYEALYYDDTMCLCFQPHPEFDGVPDCTDYYFELLARYFGEDWNGDNT